MVEHWADRQEDDNERGDFNVDAPCFKLSAGEIPEVGEEICPGKRTDNVERQKLFVAHLADAGNDRDEGADDWYITGKNDGDRPVFFIKLFGADEIFLAKYSGIGAVEELSSNPLAEQIPRTLAE